MVICVCLCVYSFDCQIRVVKYDGVRVLITCLNYPGSFGRHALSVLVDGEAQTADSEMLHSTGGLDWTLRQKHQKNFLYVQFLICYPAIYLIIFAYFAATP